MPLLPREIQIHTDAENHNLLLNDRTSREYLDLLLSRSTFAPKTRSVPFNLNVTVDPRFIVTFINPNAAAGQVTLPAANYWGAGRSPIMAIVNQDTVNLAILNAAGADTVNGAASINIAAGAVVFGVTDGVSKWYFK